MKHFFIFVLLLSITAGTVKAGYDPTIGRFLSRDPIEEKGGKNLYAHTKNNPVNKTDKLGLLTITRNSGKKHGEVCFNPGDTITLLAQHIGLKKSEWRKWLLDAKGNKLTTNPYSGKTYLIPNVVIAYWAGDLGSVGKYWVDWNKNVSFLKSKGYKVEEHSVSSTTPTGDYRIKLETSSTQANLHGTYFWGHGYTPYPSAGLAAKTPKVTHLLYYSKLALKYDISFAFIYACDSNSGKSAFKSTKWHGYTGTLVPWNGWGTLLPGINKSEWKLEKYLGP